MEAPQLGADRVTGKPESAAHRWLSVGNSNNSDSRCAGAEAAEAALTGSKGAGSLDASRPRPGTFADPKLLVVFCSTGYDPAEVLAGINGVSGGVPLVGCSMTGGFAASGPDWHQVVVTAFGGPGFTVSTCVAHGTVGRHRDAGSDAARCVAELGEPPHTALLLLTDGAAGHQEEIIGGAYDVVGASVPLVGGVASPGPDGRIFQLHNDQVLTDAAVGAAIGSDAPFGIGVRHGWRKVGEPMIVTRGERGRVYELDGKPALETYLKRHDAPAEAYVDPAIFNDFSRTRPIGVRRRSGEEARNVSSTDFMADGWLNCSGDVPEGGVIWLMEGDVDSVLAATDEACSAAVDALGGASPTGFLVFDCISRGELLDEAGRADEVRRLTRHADGAPFAGFYSWGEIARTRGINGFHHQTLVVLAVA